MDALREVARREFARYLGRAMAREFPDEAKRLGARITGTVAQGIAEAAQHGITTDDEVTSYVRTWFASGFDIAGRRPGAKEVLADAKLSPRAKVDLLQQLKK